MADDFDDAAGPAQPSPTSSPLADAVARARATPLRKGLVPRFRRYKSDDFREAPVAQIKILIVGEKNATKTTTAFNSFAGTKRCVSFDGTSKQIKDGFFADGEIHVLDGVKHWMRHDTTIEEWPTADGLSVASGAVCQLSAIDQLQYIADYFSNKDVLSPTNWVVLDDVEIAMRMITQQARFETGLAPLEKTGDGEIWQARQMIWSGLQYRALQCARNGIIYTCHPQQSNPEGWWKPKKNVQMSTGTGETSEKAPAWFRQLVNEADLILETTREWNGAAGKFSYKIHVIASKPIDGKDDMLRTGDEFDVTGFKPIPWGPGMKRWFEKITGGAMPAAPAVGAVVDEIESRAPAAVPADGSSDDGEI